MKSRAMTHRVFLQVFVQILLLSILLLTTLTTSAASTSGTTYYVDGNHPQAEDRNDHGSINKPWKTIQYALEQLQAGDILFIRGGVYNEKIVPTRNSGTEEAPITVKAYPGEKVIVQGGQNGTLLHMLRGQWWIIEDIIFKDRPIPGNDPSISQAIETGDAETYRVYLPVVKKGRGQTYYVAPNGCDSNPGTEANPWLTIQKAADTVQAGDTVYIRAGTYNEQVTIKKSGSTENYITFASYPGEIATVDGAGIDVSNRGVFNIEYKSYIIVLALRIINSKNYGFMVIASNNIIIENNYTRDTHSSGIAVWGSNNVTVDGNIIVNARNVPWSQGGHEECISIGSVSNFEVKNNEVYYDGITGYPGGAGIDVKDASRNGKVYRNYVHDVINDTGIYLDAWEAGLDPDHPMSLYNIDVYENIVDSCLSGITIGSEAGGTAENIRVYNNILSRLGWCGIVISTTSRNGPRKDIAIFNNTIYGSTDSGGAGIYVQSTNIEAVIIRNNISSFGPKWVGQIRATSMDNVVADHNLVYGPEKYPDEEVPNSIRADPEFVNPSENDFHLSPNSPAIDSGSSIDAPSYDFDGNHRPQGTGYDIGAYEYGGTAPPSPLPTLHKQE